MTLIHYFALKRWRNSDKGRNVIGSIHSAAWRYVQLRSDDLIFGGIIMDQNLSGYKIFYEVASCGNISKAAKKLYISQPAISKSIVKLEDGLDTKLFHRNSRGVTLTE